MDSAIFRELQLIADLQAEHFIPENREDAVAMMREGGQRIRSLLTQLSEEIELRLTGMYREGQQAGLREAVARRSIGSRDLPATVLNPVIRQSHIDYETAPPVAPPAGVQTGQMDFAGVDARVATRTAHLPPADRAYPDSIRMSDEERRLIFGGAPQILGTQTGRFSSRRPPTAHSPRPRHAADVRPREFAMHAGDDTLDHADQQAARQAAAVAIRKPPTLPAYPEGREHRVIEL